MTDNDHEMRSGKIDHQQKASQMLPPHIAVVTISDSRTEETDTNGHYLLEQIRKSGFELSAYRIVRDEPADIDEVLKELTELDIQLILCNGGTGLSKRDTTYDVLARKLEKVIPGFGEIFRMLSYEQVGAAAMFSRAIAGVYHGKVIISTPGSPAAVQLAWEKLIAPEMNHLIWEVLR